MRRLRKFLNFKTLFRVGVITFGVWFIVIALLGLRVHTFGETSNAEESDVIIVLGSGLRRNGEPGDALYRRSVWASQLYQQGLAPVIICTGGVGLTQTRSEASGCRDVLLARGVPDADIHLDEQSRSTEENAIYAQQIMDANGWDDAVIVTDSFHMLRANWIFDTVGVEHTYSPVPRDWMRRFYYVRHFSREIVALHWQAFKDVFNLSATHVPAL